MMDVRTLGVEEDWFKVAQDRQPWSTICEQICFSVDVGEACAANRPSLTPFTCTCGRTFKHSGHLTRHQRFCGRHHLDHGSLGPSSFHCPYGRIVRRRSQAFTFFARQHNPDPLVILSRGFPKDTAIIYGWAATGYRCVCVRVCVCVCQTKSKSYLPVVPDRQ